MQNKNNIFDFVLFCFLSSEQRIIKMTSTTETPAPTPGCSGCHQQINAAPSLCGSGHVATKVKSAVHGGASCRRVKPRRSGDGILAKQSATDSRSHVKLMLVPPASAKKSLASSPTTLKKNSGSASVSVPNHTATCTVLKPPAAMPPQSADSPQNSGRTLTLVSDPCCLSSKLSQTHKTLAVNVNSKQLGVTELSSDMSTPTNGIRSKAELVIFESGPNVCPCMPKTGRSKSAKKRTAAAKALSRATDVNRPKNLQSTNTSAAVKDDGRQMSGSKKKATSQHASCSPIVDSSAVLSATDSKQSAAISSPPVYYNVTSQQVAAASNCKQAVIVTGSDDSVQKTNKSDKVRLDSSAKVTTLKQNSGVKKAKKKKSLNNSVTAAPYSFKTELFSVNKSQCDNVNKAKQLLFRPSFVYTFMPSSAINSQSFQPQQLEHCDVNTEEDMDVTDAVNEVF